MGWCPPGRLPPPPPPRPPAPPGVLCCAVPPQVLQGKPLFPGRNVVHQLELITDLLGTPAPEIIAKVGGGGH